MLTEWFLTIWMGAALTVSTSSGTSFPMTMHYIGPMTHEVCAQVRDAIKQSQNIVRAECGPKFQMQ